jgi:hypothetical protein
MPSDRTAMNPSSGELLAQPFLGLNVLRLPRAPHSPVIYIPGGSIIPPNKSYCRRGMYLSRVANAPSEAT